MKVSFAIYLVCLVAFVGWWMFVLFAGVGLSAIPIDLAVEWKQRPRPLNKQEFDRRRNYLLAQVSKLREKGKSLEVRKSYVNKQSKLKDWKDKRLLNREIKRYESQCMIAEKEFLVLAKVANYSKTEPLIYWFKGLLAIITFALTILWLLHMFFFQLVYVFGKPFNPFFNDMLEWFIDIKLEFVSTILFCFLSYYMMMASFRGNIKFGLRFACFTFYPMVKNETFMNSFLFNALMCNIWGMSLL